MNGCNSSTGDKNDFFSAKKVGQSGLVCEVLRSIKQA